MKKRILLTSILLATTLMAYSQTPAYQVYAIKFAGSAYHFSLADWADGGPKTDSVQIDFMVWLIKGTNGKNILVDAGLLRDIEEAKEFKVVHYIRPDSALLRVGLQAGEITDIIISHPHWDHIDGLSLFANAQVWMQKEDFTYFVSTAWQKGGTNGGFAKRDVRGLIDLNLAGKLMLVDGDDKEVIPGIKVYTGSRHTFNSQFVVVHTGTNKVLLASDNIWMFFVHYLLP